MKIEKKAGIVARSQMQDASGLSCQWSVTEPRQLDSHQPSIFTVQVVLNASTTTWQTLRMCHQYYIRVNVVQNLHQA